MTEESHGPAAGRQRWDEHAPPGVSARFDDLRTGDAWRLVNPRQVLCARAPDQVRAVLQAAEQAAHDGHWAAGFVAYEAAAGLRPALPVRLSRAGEPGSELPLAWFAVFERREPAPPLEPAEQPRQDPEFPLPDWQVDQSPDQYARLVERVRGHIAAGETYQANLTTRLRAVVEDPRALYTRLALAQRGAHAALLDTGRFCVVSASPELFVDWRDGVLTSRPMKGTAPRGRWPQEDRAAAAALARSAKDRAENVMIVDLLRNDIGRLAEPGSVRVPELCRLERLETVWQLTSTVCGRPVAGTTLTDVFDALFPCGSVTGAPKHRTMQLLSELEDSPRGVYCGAIGWIGPAPQAPQPDPPPQPLPHTKPQHAPAPAVQARFSVAIRTAVVDRADHRAVYGSGGGVTWSSSAAAEYAEMRSKALLLARSPAPFALLETMAWLPGSGVRHLERHVARMGRSAEYFAFRWEPAQVRRELRAALARAPADLRAGGARVRLLLSRGGEVAVELAPLPRPGGRRPVLLAVDDEPVDSTSPWLFHKTTRREEYTRRAARHPGADDVVLVNERGELTETTRATLALRLGGRWVTPPLESGCLPGIEREVRVARGSLHEQVVGRSELRAAEGVALLSSLRGRLPALWRPADST